MYSAERDHKVPNGAIPLVDLLVILTPSEGYTLHTSSERAVAQGTRIASLFVSFYPEY